MSDTKRLVAHCRDCRNYPFGSGVRKVRGQLTRGGEICIDCFIKRDKPYTMKRIITGNNPCGGVDIYSIHRMFSDDDEKIKKLRLHNLAHYEFGLKGRRPMSSFHPIHTWEEVWKSCHGWENDLPKKFHGKLKRGIMESDGNECFAFVEHIDNRLFFISGIWG